VVGSSLLLLLACLSNSGRGASGATAAVPIGWHQQHRPMGQPAPNGKGLGGKGSGRTCVPCTLAADPNLQTANDARAKGASAVKSSKSHNCPYCKCPNCIQVWNRKKGDAIVDRGRLAATLLTVAHRPALKCVQQITFGCGGVFWVPRCFVAVSGCRGRCCDVL
jgi:hypothetical protein